MSKILVVVDMQNDFIDGSLGSAEAGLTVEKVVRKIKRRKAEGYEVVFTKDLHDENYLSTREGINLPVPHCIKGTKGERLNADVAAQSGGCKIYCKNSYGSRELIEDLTARKPETVEFVGLCTDICVLTNVIGLKAFLPEAEIVVDADCCAGSTEEGHRAALRAMESCNVTILRGENVNG